MRLGLDAANPIFYPFGCYLTPKDATWIDVIHTDMGGYGAKQSLGTAEYYANSGARPQPGCKFLGIPGSKGGNKYNKTYQCVSHFITQLISLTKLLLIILIHNKFI